MTGPHLQSIFNPPLPQQPGQRQHWGHLYGNSLALALHQASLRHTGLLLVITENTAAAQRLNDALHFYFQGSDFPLLHFPDWEILPYDQFSPHQDIISERIETLYRLPEIQRGLLVVPVQTLLHRLCPRQHVEQNSLLLQTGQTLNRDQFRARLVQHGYQSVSTVMEHGEFAVRGNLIDLYPMGSPYPYRLELFDDEVEAIRSFNPETQRTLEKTTAIRLLPAKEFPFDEAAIRLFRQQFRSQFEGDPQAARIYRDVSAGLTPAGIEYYIPLFYQQTSSLLDFLPNTTLIIADSNTHDSAQQFWSEITARYEQYRHNIERPLLTPTQLFIHSNELFEALKRFARIEWQPFEYDNPHAIHFATSVPGNFTFQARAEHPAAALLKFLAEFEGRVLFTAETVGRRETLLELLRSHGISPSAVESWQAFLHSDAPIGLTVAPLEQGLLLQDPPLAIIAEPQLFGEQVLQRRRRQRGQRDADNIIRDLAELNVGAAVVHEEYGVGRYVGLQTLTVGGIQTEFLALEYADHDKLYVPVAALHLISRYTGMSPESAPLHKLGSGQWERAKRKASERVRDVAAELLAIYAKRQARSGFAYPFDEAQYRAFAAEFPFEETPDQQTAIDNVLRSMRDPQPMDHLVCGDVGFGKTEVAMRAAFIAALAGKQVAILTPTTLLTQQHLQTFRDRFAEWPIRIAALSRFVSKKEQTQLLKELEQGKIDIIIGTHKLLQDDVKYKNLGLVIIDEEHRFGVRQKDQFKALRAEIDVLTLTATPIPRTLNMAVSGLRDLSIIATPPAKRLAIKTFVSPWNEDLIKEACLREIRRGGQVYFVHNEVDNIELQTTKLAELLPEARVHFAHGQMRERELEKVMSDFYHQRFNILVCTTIIETGIDIPNANTMVINRADHFGLAQLYQLRGRVGRSHHRAYAYLIVPPATLMTDDARRRLEAIASIETLGTGFTLATHDLEIRGAGELLGDEQSGQMTEIGYSLYIDLLNRAVAALKQGKTIDLDQPLHPHAEIDLHLPALIPEDYLPDVHERLVLYKRIAHADSQEALRDLQVEMIDRFGLLPDPTKLLFHLSSLKQKATALGIRKIDLGEHGGRIIFTEQPNIDPAKVIQLIQAKNSPYRLDGKDKLRINKNLSSKEARLLELEMLLNALKLKEAA
ncbi:MAG: transcription-repair coupling factor [Gammaproteobacteria bacterium]|nr:transcription-repair coupling factor [Gammaproteobacteria bacterium]